MAGFCDTVLSFIRKFFSLILAILIAVATLLYVIGAGIVITKEKSFANTGFAHFLAIIVALVSAIGYIALHFVPRKAYRLLYALTSLFICSLFLTSHSLGLSAYAVTKCHADHEYDHINISNVTGGGLKWQTACTGNGVLFAGAFLNILFYMVAIFDIQAVLLSRVKSKTYGERFVEMGISN